VRIDASSDIGRRRHLWLSQPGSPGSFSANEARGSDVVPLDPLALSSHALARGVSVIEDGEQPHGSVPE